MLSRPADPPGLASGNQSMCVEKSNLLTAKTPRLVAVNGDQKVLTENMLTSIVDI
jgi:hypothetical protein